MEDKPSIIKSFEQQFNDDIRPIVLAIDMIGVLFEEGSSKGNLKWLPGAKEALSVILNRVDLIVVSHSIQYNLFKEEMSKQKVSLRGVMSNGSYNIRVDYKAGFRYTDWPFIVEFLSKKENTIKYE